MLVTLLDRDASQAGAQLERARRDGGDAVGMVTLVRPCSLERDTDAGDAVGIVTMVRPSHPVNAQSPMW